MVALEDNRAKERLGEVVAEEKPMRPREALDYNKQLVCVSNVKLSEINEDNGFGMPRQLMDKLCLGRGPQLFIAARVLRQDTHGEGRYFLWVCEDKCHNQRGYSSKA